LVAADRDFPGAKGVDEMVEGEVGVGRPAMRGLNIAPLRDAVPSPKAHYSM